MRASSACAGVCGHARARGQARAGRGLHDGARSSVSVAFTSGARARARDHDITLGVRTRDHVGCTGEGMRELERERRSKSLSASPGPSSCGASPVLVEACSGCQKQNVRACCVCWRVVVVMCVVCSSGVLVRLRARVLASEHQELGACVVTCVLWAAGRIVCGCACVAAACGSRLLWSCVRAACALGGDPCFVPKEGIFFSFISCIFLSRSGDISGNFFARVVNMRAARGDTSKHHSGQTQGVWVSAAAAACPMKKVNEKKT